MDTKEKTLSKELISIFNYIKDVIFKNDPTVSLDEYSFVSGVLHCEDSLAFKSLSSVVMQSELDDMKTMFDIKISHFINDDGVDTKLAFDEYVKDCNMMCEQFNTEEIISPFLLLAIIKKHEHISTIFREYSISSVQLLNSIKSYFSEISTALVETPKKHQKKKKTTRLEVSQPIKVINSDVITSNNEVDNSLLNITQLAKQGNIPTVFGYDKYYDNIFAILAKKERNNVAICGKYGVGKTATVKNLANIINDKKCNSNFHKKTLVELDFSRLVVGTPFKGAFEQKFYTILNEAKRSGNYIFFIDNLHELLNSNTRYSETDIETLLLALLDEPSIQVISTMTEKMFSSLHKKSSLGKYFQKVTIEEPTVDEAIEIVNGSKAKYEKYHDVHYTNESIKTCVELCKKYITNRCLPDSALDFIDVIGAKVSLSKEENSKIKRLKEELSNIINEIEKVKSTSEYKLYDKIDELTKEQIGIKSRISLIEKEDILTKVPSIITKNHVCEIISKEIDIPLEELTTSEKTRLKDLNGKIKQSVIGQDEAVDEVCRAVKRQRVGLGEKERPSVLMFLGSTGTGKTYLAKELAKEVFGDEKYFVRMDMSEYADKTSINKIGGSSPGYVGYEDDTFLMKALKKHKRFVLLLDEFEKSNEEVHNMFLQMFDEGRFTDNHGEEYSLKDVIIIMTSNVGVSEATSRGRAIGFGDTSSDFTQSIIEKELKRKFKPEFLNRIQKIVYFNKLDDSNLKSIVKMEVGKINRKVEKLGYHLAQDILETRMIDEIYNTIINKKEFGARPIVNEVQRKIEDSIVDYLIDNDVEDGHTFTFEELSNL